MSRYIDADILFEYIQKEKAWKQSTVKNPRYDQGKYDAYYEMLKIIQEQPTVGSDSDVRCRMRGCNICDKLRKEKAERENGCDYCKDIDNTYSAINCDAEDADSNYFMDEETEESHFKFCPNCGRKLVD